MLLALLDDVGVDVAYGLLVGVVRGVGIRGVGVGVVRGVGVGVVRVRDFHALLGRLKLLPRKAALHGGNLR